MIQNSRNNETTFLTMDHEHPVVNGIASNLLPVGVSWDNPRKLSRRSLNVSRVEIDHGLWDEFLYMHVKSWLLLFLLLFLYPNGLWHGHCLLLYLLVQSSLLLLEGLLKLHFFPSDFTSGSILREFFAEICKSELFLI